MNHRFDVDGKPVAVWLSRFGSGYRLLAESEAAADVALEEQAAGVGSLTLDGHAEAVAYAVEGDSIHVHCRGRSYTFEYVDPLQAFESRGDDNAQNLARAPMPGTVVSVGVAPGDRVTAGTVLMVIESMKLETSIRAPQDGAVEKVYVKPGDSFDRDFVLVSLAQEND